MKYEAVRYGARDGVVFNNAMANAWVVYEGKIPKFSRFMSESEAKIIVFALNAVTEGRILNSLEPRNAWKPETGEIWYDGPTEGVAP